MPVLTPALHLHYIRSVTVSCARQEWCCVVSKLGEDYTQLWVDSYPQPCTPPCDLAVWLAGVEACLDACVSVL